MKLDAPAVFELRRIRLRKATVEDAAAIYEYGSDPAVARYADWPCRTSIQPLIESIKARAATWGEGGIFSWVITTLDDDRSIGGVTCAIEGDAAEIGFLLNQSFWGFGYAVEAATGIINWLFSLPNITRVWATCDTENASSIRVLEKLGFTREKTLTRAIVRPQLSPQPRDAFLYARGQLNAQQAGAQNP